MLKFEKYMGQLPILPQLRRLFYTELHSESDNQNKSGYKLIVDLTLHTIVPKKKYFSEVPAKNMHISRDLHEYPNNSQSEEAIIEKKKEKGLGHLCPEKLGISEKLPCACVCVRMAEVL